MAQSPASESVGLEDQPPITVDLTGELAAWLDTPVALPEPTGVSPAKAPPIAAPTAEGPAETVSDLSAPPVFPGAIVSPGASPWYAPPVEGHAPVPGEMREEVTAPPAHALEGDARAPDRGHELPPPVAAGVETESAGIELDAWPTDLHALDELEAAIQAADTLSDRSGPLVEVTPMPVEPQPGLRDEVAPPAGSPAARAEHTAREARAREASGLPAGSVGPAGKPPWPEPAERFEVVDVQIGPEMPPMTAVEPASAEAANEPGQAAGSPDYLASPREPERSGAAAPGVFDLDDARSAASSPGPSAEALAVVDLIAEPGELAGSFGRPPSSPEPEEPAGWAAFDTDPTAPAAEAARTDEAPDVRQDDESAAAPGEFGDRPTDPVASARPNLPSLDWHGPVMPAAHAAHDGLPEDLGAAPPGPAGLGEVAGAPEPAELDAVPSGLTPADVAAIEWLEAAAESTTEPAAAGDWVAAGPAPGRKAEWLTGAPGGWPAGVAPAAGDEPVVGLAARGGVPGAGPLASSSGPAATPGPSEADLDLLELLNAPPAPTSGLAAFTEPHSPPRTGRLAGDAGERAATAALGIEPLGAAERPSWPQPSGLDDRLPTADFIAVSAQAGGGATAWDLEHAVLAGSSTDLPVTAREPFRPQIEPAPSLDRALPEPLWVDEPVLPAFSAGGPAQRSGVAP